MEIQIFFEFTIKCFVYDFVLERVHSTIYTIYAEMWRNVCDR